MSGRPLSLTIKTPQQIAYNNAINQAEELNQPIESGSYKSPSLLTEDNHSDLDATSPKITFKETIHYISVSPLSSCSTPHENINLSPLVIKDTKDNKETSESPNHQNN